MAKIFSLLTFFICFTVNAQVALSPQIERKIFLMLMEYNTKKESGPKGEELARQRFLQRFEDLWVKSGMQTPVPFDQVESLLTVKQPETEESNDQAFKGRIRLKRQFASKDYCIEYQDGLLVRELPLQQCP